MYEAHKITKFTYFHLIHNSEALFFNILIRTNHFRSKNDLLCATNNEKKSYPWMSRSSSQTWTIQEYLLQYAHCNLVDTYNRSQLLEQLLEDYPYLNHEHILQDIHISIRYQKKKNIEYKTRANTYWPRVRYWYCEYGAHWGTTTRYGQHCSKFTWFTCPPMYSTKWKNFFVKYIAQYFQNYNKKKSHSFRNDNSSCA